MNLNLPEVENMTSERGNDIPNQFIIKNVTVKYKGKNYTGSVFQSYSSVIAFRAGSLIILDKNKWDYSTTTGKYRNRFLRETKRETEQNIKSGRYVLDDLN